MALVVRDPFEVAADELDPPEPEYAGDPVGFIREKLHAHLWSKQTEILEAINRHQRVAVPACFGSSKSFTAGKLAAAWIEGAPPGRRKVVTTSASFRQVRAILWPEIQDAHVRGSLIGRLNKTEWHVPVGGGEVLVGFGAATRDPTRFQGHHAPDGVLTIIDEADGVAQAIYDAAEGLLISPSDRLLVIGNPWDPTGPFAEACKPGSGFKVIRITAFDTPNFTGEDMPEEVTRALVSKAWVADKVKRWGKKDPRYISKVLARFPKEAEGTLIHLIWFEEAQARKLRSSMPIEIAVDVGGDTGGDETVIGVRRGNRYRTHWSSREHDTMEIAGEAAAAQDELGASIIKIDATGIGKGVYDRLRELGKSAVPIIAGSKPRDSGTFLNLRAEMAWGVRKRFEDDDIDVDPDDEDLASQSVKIKWKRNSRGQIVLESKDDMKRRGLPSPDRFDTMCMAFYPIAMPKPEKRSERSRRSESVMAGVMDDPALN